MRRGIGLGQSRVDLVFPEPPDCRVRFLLCSRFLLLLKNLPNLKHDSLYCPYKELSVCQFFWGRVLKQIVDSGVLEYSVGAPVEFQGRHLVDLEAHGTVLISQV